VSLDEFELGEQLGEDVFVAREKEPGKQVFLYRARREDTSIDYFTRSVVIQSSLRLPGVSRVIGFGFDVTSDLGILVEEFLPNATFDLMIDARLNGELPSEFGPTEFSKVIFGVAAIMSQIHARDIIHRDLNPGSIALDEKWEPHITNFWMSRFDSDCSELTDCTDGTPVYMAPELRMEPSPITNKFDIFCYGTLIYNVFTPYFEFRGGICETSEQLTELIRDGERMIRVPEIPDKLWELISECWSQEPEDRPSFAEITDRMLKSNDFVLDGTNLDAYHEYQQRIMSELNACPIRVNNSAILKALRGLGLDIDSMRGIRI
jgi:serine/threonine protein kinase